MKEDRISWKKFIVDNKIQKIIGQKQKKGKPFKGSRVPYNSMIIENGRSQSYSSFIFEPKRMDSDYPSQKSQYDDLDISKNVRMNESEYKSQDGNYQVKYSIKSPSNDGERVEGMNSKIVKNTLSDKDKLHQKNSLGIVYRIKQQFEEFKKIVLKQLQNQQKYIDKIIQDIIQSMNLQINKLKQNIPKNTQKFVLQRVQMFPIDQIKSVIETKQNQKNKIYSQEIIQSTKPQNLNEKYEIKNTSLRKQIKLNTPYFGQSNQWGIQMNIDTPPKLCVSTQNVNSPIQLNTKALTEAISQLRNDIHELQKIGDIRNRK